MFSSRLNHLWSYKVFTTLPCYSSMTISLFMSIWDTGKHALAYFISFHSHVEVRISFPGWKWQHVAELTEMAGLFALFFPWGCKYLLYRSPVFFFFCLISTFPAKFRLEVILWGLGTSPLESAVFSAYISEQSSSLLSSAHFWFCPEQLQAHHPPHMTSL